MSTKQQGKKSRPPKPRARGSASKAPAAPISITPAPSPLPTPASAATVPAVPLGVWVRILTDAARPGLVKFEPQWPSEPVDENDFSRSRRWVRVVRDFALPRFGHPGEVPVQAGQFVEVCTHHPRELDELKAAGLVEPFADANVEGALVPVMAVAPQAAPRYRPVPPPLSVDERCKPPVVEA